ncbi:MAG: tetratricopeptide repeat protein [Saprospiraceae bacterium]|nr:tetratricopeptide repeat protein [Saprospiraceae bacterium]
MLNRLILKQSIHCRSNIVILLIAGIFFLSPISLLAQTYEETIDSLLVVLKETHDPQRKVDRLNEISYAYRRVSVNKMIDFAHQARALALQNGYRAGLAVAYKNMGNGHYKAGSPPDTTNTYYTKALYAAKQVGDHYTHAASLNNLGLLANTHGSYKIGAQYLQKALIVFDEQVKDPNKIGLRCLILANLGNSYFELGDFERSFDFQSQSIELARKSQIRFIPAQYLDDLARSAASMEKYTLAEQYYKESLSLQTEIGDFQSSIHTYLHFMEMKMAQKDYTAAAALGRQSVEIAIEREFPILVADGLNKLSELARMQAEVDKAVMLADSALRVSRSIFNIRHERTASYNLAQALALKKDYSNAFTQLLHHQRLNDSIIREDEKAITMEVQAQYRNRLFEQKVGILEAKQKAQRKNIELLIGLIVMTIILLGVITTNLLKRNRVNRIIQDKNAVLEKYIAYNLQLENFAYIASHDLKSPLRNVVSFSQLLARRLKDKITSEEKDYLNFIISGTKEMSSLIDDLLNYSLVQREKLNVEKIAVKELLQRVVDRNQPLIEEAEAAVEIQAPATEIRGDAIKLNQLLENLFTNALKFHQADEKPKVQIKFEEREKEYFFEVKDHGIGIDPQYFEKVFMIFKRLHTKKEYEGTGIGLAICKKIVEQHGGRIWLESQLGEGTSFFFTLPKEVQTEAN